VEAIGLYRFHHPDPRVPYAESVGAPRELLDEGRIRMAGISKAGELGSGHAAFARVAEARGVSPQRVCLAWMLAESPVVVPIPGASRPETIRDSLAATDLDLTTGELAELTPPEQTWDPPLSPAVRTDISSGRLAAKRRIRVNHERVRVGCECFRAVGAYAAKT
jgi:aryl-alcohol dehydrogenase-like predicted oxidoreductase